MNNLVKKEQTSPKLRLKTHFNFCNVTPWARPETTLVNYDALPQKKGHQNRKEADMVAYMALHYLFGTHKKSFQNRALWA